MHIKRRDSAWKPSATCYIAIQVRTYTVHMPLLGSQSNKQPFAKDYSLHI